VAILVAFATPDHNLVPGKLEVFDSQAAAFHESQSGSIEEHGHHPGSTLQATEEPPDLLFREHHRQSAWPFGPDNSFDRRREGRACALTAVLDVGFCLHYQ